MDLEKFKLQRDANAGNSSRATLHAQSTAASAGQPASSSSSSTIFFFFEVINKTKLCQSIKQPLNLIHDMAKNDLSRGW